MTIKRTLLGLLFASSCVSDRRDRDNDGVPNRRDSHPTNPNRS